MNVEFTRFQASDGVELQGWLSNVGGDTTALHIHGMSGNGYENNFLDNLRAGYTENGISFFAIDTRGRGIISDFRQGGGWKRAGSCYEIFEESADDIQGALDYLRGLGKNRIVLQGHSLGCTKVVNFLLNREVSDIEKVILLAPTDMTGWASTDSHHKKYLTEAKRLQAEGKGEELVAAECWLDKTPLSAQTYPSLCEGGGPADIYGDREGGALLGKLTLPTLIVYGDQDIGITQIDGTMDAWLERVSKIKNDNTQVHVIEGAPHSFRGYEEKLAAAVTGFANFDRSTMKIV